MMRIVLLFFFLSSFLPLSAQRKGVMTILGNECEYDTLAYRHIAPGASYLQVQFNDIPQGKFNFKMRAHLICIDMTNEYASYSSDMAEDKFYTISKQANEVARQKKNGRKPVASMNGSAFNTIRGNSSTAGSYEISSNLIYNSEIKYTVSSTNINMYTDHLKKVHAKKTHFKGTVTNAAGQQMTIGQVNHFRNHADSKKQLTLFCNGIPQTQSTKPETGTDVILKKQEGDKVLVGRNQMVVKSVLEGCAHTLQPGEAALSGYGDTEGYLKGLKPGDVITLDLDYYDEQGNNIVPTDMTTRFKDNCIVDGVGQDIDTKYYAISAIGASKDGNTCYWGTLEMGTYSNAPAAAFRDLLLGVGAWDAMWLDGSVSAEMTVDGAYVTHSSMTGRYIPSGFILYSNAPDDNTLASIECANQSRISMSLGESCPLQLYGYNTYGEMICPDASTHKDVEISCPSTLGYFSNGQFTATGTGTGTINIAIKGKGTVLQLPVSVKVTSSLEVYPKEFFTGEGRSCQATLTYHENGQATQVPASEVMWTTDNSTVIASCQDGLIQPFIDGYAEVYANYNGLTDTIRVTVENLEEEGITELDLTDFIKAPYDFDYQLPSVPRSMKATIINHSDKDAQLAYESGHVLKLVDVEKKETDDAEEITVTFDYDAPDTYPIILRDVNPHSEVTLTRLIACYTSELDAIRSPYRDASAKPYRITRQQGTIQLTTSHPQPATITLYDLDGTLISQVSTNSSSTSLYYPLRTPVIVRVKTKDGLQITKIR